MTMPSGIGFKHTSKGRHKNGNVVWRCTIRDKQIIPRPPPGAKQKFSCPGRVLQTGENRFEIRTKHMCEGRLHLKELVGMDAEIKKKAVQEKWKPPKTVVESVMRMYNDENPGMKLKHPRNSERMAVYAGGKRMPSHPKDLNFVLNHHALPPDFLRGDIRVDDARHLLFATDTQMKLLSTAKRWYVDGTFKLIRAPFIQMWSIHAFIRRGDIMKQVPLFFILMSRRTV